MSSLGSQRLVHCELYVPASGGWWADCKLEQGAAPAVGSTVTLTIKDLALVGKVTSRSALDAPASPRVVVEGGLGWNTLLPSPGGSYASAGGVRLSTVLGDLAAIAGESFVAPADYILGNAYGWDASDPNLARRCSSVLADLVDRGALVTWRVDPASGAAVFTPWPSIGAADQHATLIGDRNMSRGVREFSINGSVAALLPGATIDKSTIARVQFVETADSIHATTWDVESAAPTADQSMRTWLLRLFPFLARFGARPTGQLKPVARVGDGTGYLYAQTATGNIVAVYYSAAPPPLAVWVPIVMAPVPPTPTTAGTPVSIQTGSARVSCS